MPTKEMLDALKSFSSGKWSKFINDQESVISNILVKKNTLAVMPTGSGKSLCYQLPVYMGLKPAIVISPLISLMKDQFDSLFKTPLKADYLNSSKSFKEQSSTLSSFISGNLDVLFVSPERLADGLFITGITKFAKQKPVFFVVDEAHCITEWGHDFRQDYMDIPNFINRFKDPVVLAITATASRKTREEISKVLNIEPNNVFKAKKICNDNLDIQIDSFANKEQKEKKLELLLKTYDKPGIVYTNGKDTAEKLAIKFKNKYKTAFYHSEVKSKDKDKILNNFRDGKIDVLFATNAFGMGIDIKAIRFIIHFRVPHSIDQYVQEIGRAGRDGKTAHCNLFFTQVDEGLVKRQIKSSFPDVSTLSDFLYDPGPFGIYAMPTYNAEIKNEMAIKYLCKYGYLELIGDTCTEITYDKMINSQSYKGVNNIIDVNATARTLKKAPHEVLDKIYNDFFNGKLSIASRSNMHQEYKIKKQELSRMHIKEIERDLYILLLFKEKKYEQLKDVMQKSTKYLNEAINEYFE